MHPQARYKHPEAIYICGGTPARRRTPRLSLYFMVELPRGDVHLFYGGTPTRRRTLILRWNSHEETYTHNILSYVNS